MGGVGFDRIFRVSGEKPRDVGQVVVGTDAGDVKRRVGVIQGPEVFVLPGLLVY